MKTLLGCLKMDFERSLKSYAFLGSILFVVFIRFLSILKINFFDQNVLYVFETAVNSDLKLLLFPIAALPFASSFCSDWSNRYIRPTLIRSSIASYSISKAITCFFTSCLVIILGNFLFLSVCALILPISGSSPESIAVYSYSPTYGQLVMQGKYLLYFGSRIVMESFYYALYSLIALAISTKITNVFVTLAMPLVIHYSIINISTTFALPDILRFYLFMDGGLVVGGILTSFLLTILYPVVLAVIVAFFFSRGVKERVQNG